MESLREAIEFFNNVTATTKDIASCMKMDIGRPVMARAWARLQERMKDYVVVLFPFRLSLRGLPCMQETGPKPSKHAECTMSEQTHNCWASSLPNNCGLVVVARGGE